MKPTISASPIAAEPPEPLYWTPAEFAGAVVLSPKSVYRLAKDDPTFPVIKIGGSIRIPKDRALKWLRDREQGRPRLTVARGERRPA